MARDSCLDECTGLGNCFRHVKVAPAEKTAELAGRTGANSNTGGKLFDKPCSVTSLAEVS